MVLTIVTNAPPTPTQNSGDVSVPMTCTSSPFLPLRTGFPDGHTRSINMLGGGGRGEEGRVGIRIPGILILAVRSKPVETLHP